MIGMKAIIITIIGEKKKKKIGNYFGDKFEIVGGVILILLGFKILLEGLGILVLYNRINKFKIKKREF